jgi:aspartate aminotransferase
MAPGNGFYSDSKLGLNQVRLAYVLDIDHLDRAINCLEIGLQQYESK